MYIISKFKDYYDIGSSLGIDKTNVYKRVEETLTLNNANNKLQNEHPDLNAFRVHGRRSINYSKLSYFKPYTVKYGDVRDYWFKKHIIAVCGKLYSVVLFPEDLFSNKYHIFYNYEQVKEHLIKNGGQVPKKDSFKGSNFSLFDRLFFNNEVIDSDINIFYKTPILSYTINNRYDESTLTLTLNPELNKFEFYRVFDPYTMFQEVSMYNSGVLTSTEDNMIQISDEDKKVAKGFDNYSFKKLPTKKR